MASLVKAGKIAAKSVKKGAEWYYPIHTDLDTQIKYAFKDKAIQEAYDSFDGSPEQFIEELEKYIKIENYKNRKLKSFGSKIDATNKTLVPVDATLDAFAIFGGVGTGLKALMTLGKLPAYLAYNLYYLAKTHDFKGALGNLAYEATSWALPGSATHLINKYAPQADKYATKKGIERFLKGLEKKVLEPEKKKRFSEKKKSQDLDSILQGATA
ncbi:hypothetical protein COU58_01550 [Candidatus Pacearchaeota archaeon CG10_big_fil_rev_8_21_14_0_10_32_42]|nr:MAG: hypothetical protein COU58_01550 [Candidatus Pacearchaeota archaeon CG10_big_fil_rev_8_21_14_0_10_32_42]